jgi:hypothetical protein
MIRWSIIDLMLAVVMLFVLILKWSELSLSLIIVYIVLMMINVGMYFFNREYERIAFSSDK